MKYGALFGWGIVMYAVMTLSWSGLTIYGVAGSDWSLIAQLIILIIVTTIAGRSLRLDLWPDILPYSLGWAAIAMLLDIVYVVPFFGWEMFYAWRLWVGYALIVIVPLIAPKTRPSAHTGDV